MATTGQGPGRRKAAPLGKVLGFMRLIWAIDHGLQKASKRMNATLGLTGPQRLVIRIVGRTPGVTAGELADILHVHPSTLTGILRRLESRRLLERAVDPGDGRRSFLRLTTQGRAFDQPTNGVVENAVRQALSGFSEKELRAACDVLDAVADGLRDDPPAARPLKAVR